MPTDKFWWDERRCHFCGATDDLIPGGTIHIGGHGEVPIWKCQNAAKCMQNSHNNVRYGRRPFDAGKKEEVRVNAE